MNKLTKLTAGLSLALAFTFSCSGGDDSEVVGESSSSGGSSSSSIGIVYGTLVTYEDEIYQTVVIGSQTWFAKNLNYNASGSKCYGEGGLVRVYDEEKGYYINKTLSAAEVQANCAKYGRLYNWATAMALDASCNDDECSTLISTPHKGVCPTGWHIPSYDDWDELMEAVGGYGIMGTHLKAANGWNNDGNGTDKYGFSALPGGYGDSYGNFRAVDISGSWWSSMSSSEDEYDNAYYRYMSYDHRDARWHHDYKSYLLSVRCVKD